MAGPTERFGPIPLLQRRQIEAEIVGPLFRAMCERFGREPSLDLLREVITELARKAGAQFADRVGDTSLDSFAQALDTWTAGGALELEILEQSAEHLDFDVKRCRYAELYRDLGLADLGASLSCVRDGAMIEGFNAELTLERTQTIMEGAPFCDFRFRRAEPPAKS